MNDNELSRALVGLVADRKRLGAPQTLHEKVWAIPTTTPPEPHWLQRLGTGRFQSLFNATKFVVAGAIVALFGGFLLSGVLTAPSDDALPAASATATPESTTAPPIQLPTDIPADVRSGLLETPFGPARWVHLTGDDTSLPSQLFELHGTESGYIVADWDGQTGTSRGLWRSPDLIRWTLEEPLGIGPGSASSGGSETRTG